MSRVTTAALAAFSGHEARGLVNYAALGLETQDRDFGIRLLNFVAREVKDAGMSAGDRVFLERAAREVLKTYTAVRMLRDGRSDDVIEAFLEDKIESTVKQLEFERMLRDVRSNVEARIGGLS
jgi:hypothetical protein